MFARRRRPIRCRGRPLADPTECCVLRWLRLPSVGRPAGWRARGVRPRAGRPADRRRRLARSSVATSAWPRSIFAASSAIWLRRARSSARREIKPVADCRGPTTSVPSGATSSPSWVTNCRSAAVVAAQWTASAKRFDDPGFAQQAFGQHGEFGSRFDELIGPADHPASARSGRFALRRSVPARRRAARRRHDRSAGLRCS